MLQIFPQQSNYFTMELCSSSVALQKVNSICVLYRLCSWIVNQNLRNLLQAFSLSVKIEVASNVHLLETIPDKTAVIPGKPIQISITHSTQGDHITPNIHLAQ